LFTSAGMLDAGIEIPLQLFVSLNRQPLCVAFHEAFAVPGPLVA
jgi:hypothetical protein